MLPAVPSDVMRLMIQSYADYTQPASFRVSVGTWNVNGGKHFRSIAFKHEHITDWLLDLPKIIRSTARGMSMLLFCAIHLSDTCDFIGRFVCSNFFSYSQIFGRQYCCMVHAVGYSWHRTELPLHSTAVAFAIQNKCLFDLLTSCRLSVCLSVCLQIF